MAKNLRISVSEPCHEDWQQMTPADKGRHCKSCDKVVIDFSRMTDAQVVDHFKNYQGKTCGRFRTEQLDRPMPLSVGQRLFRPIKYIAASLLAIEVFSQKAQARDIIDTVSLQSVQVDTTLVSLVADNLVADSCAIAELDSCGSDSTAHDYSWLTGDTVVTPTIGDVITVSEVSINGGIYVTLGWCSLEPAIPEYKNQRPVFLYPLRKYIFENLWPFKKWNEQKLPTHFINQASENTPAQKNAIRHFSFAAIVRRLKIKKG